MRETVPLEAERGCSWPPGFSGTTVGASSGAARILPAAAASTPFSTPRRRRGVQASLPHALLMFDLDAGGSRGLRCMVLQMQTVLCITQEIEFLPTFVSKA